MIQSGACQPLLLVEDAARTAGVSKPSFMPRKQRVRVEEDEEDDELPSDLVPSRRIARKPRKQRLKDEDEETGGAVGP